MKTNIQPKKLVYRISDKADIVNHFSPEGFELLSDSFMDFIDLNYPAATSKEPLLLEIIGTNLEQEDKQKIDYAIWLHYRLKMTNIARDLKSFRRKIIWFLIGMILSGLFLYLIKKSTNEVITQLFYLPIWFFGWRLLTYPIVEYLPMRRELNYYRRLAAMTPVFTETPMEEVTDKLTDRVFKENAIYYDQAMEGIRQSALAEKFARNDGTIIISANASSSAELLSSSYVAGSENISRDFADFLAQAEPFVTFGKKAELHIQENGFTEEEKTTVSKAVSNYYNLYFPPVRKNLSDTIWRIIIYAICLIIACVVLFLLGGLVDITAHEIMIIVLWFFGDYLVEFVLIDLVDARFNINIHQKLKDMKIRFIEK